MTQPLYPSLRCAVCERAMEHRVLGLERGTGKTSVECSGCSSIQTVRLQEASVSPAVAPGGEPWRAALVDPPWPEHGGGKIKRGADRHYPLVPVADMFSVISLSPAWTPAEDAHLYLWVTNNCLPAGLRLMADLGFRYVTNLCWVKDRAGLGQYFRGQHELLLFGVRGRGIDLRTERRDITTVVDAPPVEDATFGAPRGRHSAKPELFHALVEARSPGPYQEIFARSQRAGWRTWGNEVG